MMAGRRGQPQEVHTVGIQCEMVHSHLLVVVHCVEGQTADNHPVVEVGHLLEDLQILASLVGHRQGLHEVGHHLS